jgi:hypothetical protein
MPAETAQASTVDAIVKEAGNYFRREHALVVCLAHTSYGILFSDLHFAPFLVDNTAVGSFFHAFIHKYIYIRTLFKVAHSVS